MSTIESLQGEVYPAEALTERMDQILDDSRWQRYRRRFSRAEMEVRERVVERASPFGTSLVTYRQRRKVSAPEQIGNEIDLLWLADGHRELDSWGPSDTIHPYVLKTRETILGWAEQPMESGREAS